MTVTWLEVIQGDRPLIVALPHTGIEIPLDIEARLVSPWLARKDTDWWVNQLYSFANDLGATIIRTAMSRTVIDVNRDPSGASLYPGSATTELCPTTSFDGEALYQAGAEPDAAEVRIRRECYFEPYHAAIQATIARLHTHHRNVVLYDAHAIRSEIPRLFAGELPHLNIGTNNGRTCDPVMEAGVMGICRASSFSLVQNGRFRGGWTTRHYGDPANGLHALQMELACRGYMNEAAVPDERNWPPSYDQDRAAPLRTVLTAVLSTCLEFINERN